MEDTNRQVSEILQAVVSVYARQMALIEVVQEMGATKEQLDTALKKAELRLQKVALASSCKQR